MKSKRRSRSSNQKTELLIQWEGLTEGQLAQIQAIDQAATKLSRLNQSLLLLTKIENRQFEYDAAIDFQSLIEVQLTELDEFIQLQQVTVQKQIAHSKMVRMNPVLADVLLWNLLTNAIRYCSKPGIIQISLDTSQFIIANTGAPLKMRAAQIFERFKKEQQSSDSLGLGLAIVKKICDLYDYQIQYAYQNNYHSFKIIL
jgi:signal transduction histidine kinase